MIQGRSFGSPARRALAQLRGGWGSSLVAVEFVAEASNPTGWGGAELGQYTVNALLGAGCWCGVCWKNSPRCVARFDRWTGLSTWRDAMRCPV